MKILNLIVRILLGLMVLVFGANKLYEFMPPPEMDPESAAYAFMMALMGSGYLMKVVGLVEVLAGISVLLNKYASLMLVILMPISLNAFMFHLFLDPATIPGAAFLLVANLYLMWTRREDYAGMLKA